MTSENFRARIGVVSTDAIKKELSKSPYYVVYLDGNENKQINVVRVKDFSQEEFDEFVQARDTIEEQVFQYMNLYTMVAIMYDNLTEAYTKRVAEVKAQRGINARDDLTELNAYFAALIANLGMYLGCVPNKISSKRREILDLHNKATNEEYDSSFAYRLFCVLRNYTLHDTPPITGISGSSRMAKKVGEVEVSYEIFIEKSKLMQNSVVSRKLAKDFALPTEKYQVMKLAKEVMYSLRNIHWKTIKALLAPIEKEVALIQSLASLTPSKKQCYIASISYNEKTHGMDAQLNLIHSVMLDEITSRASKY